MGITGIAFGGAKPRARTDRASALAEGGGATPAIRSDQARRRRVENSPSARSAPAEDAEHVAQVTELLAAGRRGAADIIEDLAVLHAVIGQPLDFAAAIEIHRHDASVGFLLRQER